MLNLLIMTAVGAALIIAGIAGWRSRRYHTVAPTIMTSLGIGGTFLGVTFALMSMPDGSTTADFQAGVNDLLDSMRLAFVTSLMGLAASVAFRFLRPSPPPDTLSGIEAPDEKIGETLTAIRNAIAGDSDSSLVTQLQKLRDENRDGFKQIDGRASETERALVDVRTAIAGSGDTSLVTQLQKLRDENRSGFEQLGGLTEIIRDSLLKSLENLSEELRDILANQLRASLEDLIGKIEKALVEQFGKTFVEFNEATQAIKKWQEDHRAHIEQLTTAFETTADRMSSIADDCERIPPTLVALETAVGHTNRGTEEMNRHLQAFAELKTAATQALPTIKENLDSIGEDLKSAAAGYSSLDEELRAAFGQAASDVKDLISKSAKQLDEQINREVVATGDARDQITNLSKRVATQTTEAYSKLHNSVTDLFQTFSDEFVQAMNAEVRNTANSWGSSMVAIGQKVEEAIATNEQRRR